jgi:two-component system, OmpR family, response regulator MprA
MRLLVVEDERRMLDLLRRGLTEEGHVVVCASDGCEGLLKLRDEHFDLVILDIMMPKLDGYEVAQLMRSENNPTPVLMLTAKDTVSDIVHGLDVGADDYLTKPFSFHELLLRLRAVQRRVRASTKSQYQIGDLLLDCATRDVVRDGRRVSLSRTEYCLLERLMRDARNVVPRHLLIEAVWGDSQPVTENSLEVYIRLLRNKIDGDHVSKLIHTVRGTGYVIREESAA